VWGVAINGERLSTDYPSLVFAQLAAINAVRRLALAVAEEAAEALGDLTLGESHTTRPPGGNRTRELVN
jgi:hypothetical protein